MQSRLIVKNFGPIKSVDLDLRNVNVFIGPQATGKSALAKIYTIFKSPRKFFRSVSNQSGPVLYPHESFFKDALDEYNVGAFLNDQTEIEFYSALHSITYRQGRITYNPKTLNKIRRLELLVQQFADNEGDIKRELLDFCDNFVYFAINVYDLLGGDEEEFEMGIIGEMPKFETLDQETALRIIPMIKEQEETLSTNTALYIPAERNFINIIKKASLNLQLNNVPIPKNVLSFGAELEKSTLGEIDLGFLHENLVYKNVGGEDRIFTAANHSIKLSDAASGIQSALPILIPIMHGRTQLGHHSFVIEEPEMNLFPLAQYELIKKLESLRYESYWEDYGMIHTYTTHSPYILAAINNLLYAHKVEIALLAKNQEHGIPYEATREMVASIVSAAISPDYFTAWQIFDGTAQPIMDRGTGLIKENFIDDSTDRIGDDFDALTELLNQEIPFSS